MSPGAEGFAISKGVDLDFDANMNVLHELDALGDLARWFRLLFSPTRRNRMSGISGRAQPAHDWLV